MEQDQQEILFALWRAHKLRLTKTRQALARLFSHHTAPLSVARILRTLRATKYMLDKTTVYRELECMQQLGMIQSVRLGDRQEYYELASREHHHHLICVQCRRVEDTQINEQVLLKEVQRMSRKKNFSITRHAFEFFGVCAQCQNAC